MGEVVCEVCGRKIDSRGLSGHMKTHKTKVKGDGDNEGIISYPENKPGGTKEIERQKISESTKKTALDESPRKPPRKQVKPPSSPASSPASKPASSSKATPQATSGASRAGHTVKQGAPQDTRGQRKSEAEFKGFFR